MFFLKKKLNGLLRLKMEQFQGKFDSEAVDLSKLFQSLNLPNISYLIKSL